MAKGLVLLLCDEHDLSGLYARMPGGVIYAETLVSRDDCARLSVGAFAEQILIPMVATLRHEQEWPRA